MSIVLYLIVDIIAIYFMACSNDFNNMINVKNSATHYRESLLLHKRYIKKSKLYLRLSFITLFLLAALRDGVGKDYVGYAQAFIAINNGTITEIQKNWLGIGFRVLCKIIGLINSQSFVIMFAILSFITLLLWYKSIERHSINRALSVFVLICLCLYYQTFNQSRQMMAIAITTYGYRYLVEKDLKRYAIVVLIATTIHPSAIVMLAPYFFGSWKINFKNISFYFLGAIGVYFLFEKIMYILSFTNYGATYIQWTKYNIEYSANSILNLVVRVVMLMGCLMFAKSTVKRNPETQYLYNMVILCTILQVLTIRSYLFGRVTTYFFIFYIFLIPEVVETITIKMKNKVLIYGVVIIAMLIYHFIYYYSSQGASGSGYEVYKSLLF
jgi:transmembrane protein EpsG